MHRAKVFLLAAVSLVSACMPGVALASAQEDILGRIDEDVEAINYFSHTLEEEEYFPESAREAIPDVKAQFRNSVEFFAAYNPGEDEGLRQILVRLTNSSQELLDSIESFEVSYASKDPDAYDVAFDDYGQAIDAYNLAIDAANEHYGLTDSYGFWLGLMFWLSAAITSVFFLLSRQRSVVPAEHVKHKFELALFKASLWPFAGSAISYFWYIYTPPGGTFYVLWWIIALGYYQFFYGLYKYYRFALPSINKARKVQHEKLQKLLQTDDFNADELLAQAQEITNNAPIIHIGSRKHPHSKE